MADVNPDLWQVLTLKTGPTTEGWVRATNALTVDGVGTFLNTVGFQTGPDGARRISEGLTFAPGVKFAIVDGVPSLVAI